MDIGLFLRGLVIGFSIAAPVGPIGILCIRRTLADGRLAGLLAGLGAATADAIYGCVAGFGLTVISSFLVDQRVWIQLAGGLFLLMLGIRTLAAPPARNPAAASGTGLAAGYLSTFLLTLTNPMTILSFAAIFAALGVARTGGDFAAAALLVLGVFLGSAAWWLLLSGGVGLVRERLNPAILRWVNRLSGLILVIFGAAALWAAAG
ncbi:MAG: LysE family translocator [Desulfobacterales bacterium]|jgi:threonine/homoserine/homoserine lactone efflux protein|nr:LysE family translocator [Desulfobacterales bacterium]MCU0584520.1 LysE family translocator [Desulfobacterales bacterium]